MTPKAIQSQIAHGEDSKRQFKVNVRNAESLAAEMAAFANSEGGQMFLGVGDDGSTPGLLRPMFPASTRSSAMPPVNWCAVP